MELRDRCVGKDIALRNAVSPIEPLHPSIDMLEHERGCRRLEGAAHRKALAAAMRDYRPGGRIQDRASEAPAATFLYLSQASLQPLAVGRPGSAARGEGKKRPGQRVAARYQISS